MLTVMLGIMIILLLLNFPMMIPLIVAPFVVAILGLTTMPLDMSSMVGQLITGIESYQLLCVPLFIFAADIMTSGRTSNRLLDLVGSFIGHIRGGYAVTTAASCSMFGAISGSTQATVVAIGKPMRERLLKVGYKDSSAMALIINSSDVALLIPPSIGLIMYGLASGASIGKLFIAGIIPGLIVFLTFATYSVIYAKVKNIPLAQKATWKERWQAFKKALLPLGFPVLVIGGIYAGWFSATEAAGISVLYAFLLEVVIYRSIHIKQLPNIALSTGLVTSAVFILVAGGQVFSFIVNLEKIPQMLSDAVLGSDPSQFYILLIVTIFFFVGCMFVDPIVVILVLTPIFHPIAVDAGISEIHLGIIITFQAALGSATPPFGVDIFTASAVFNKPYLEVIKGTPPYILMMILISVLLIVFEDLSTILL